MSNSRNEQAPTKEKLEQLQEATRQLETNLGASNLNDVDLSNAKEAETLLAILRQEADAEFKANLEASSLTEQSVIAENLQRSNSKLISGTEKPPTPKSSVKIEKPAEHSTLEADDDFAPTPSHADETEADAMTISAGQQPQQTAKPSAKNPAANSAATANPSADPILTLSADQLEPTADMKDNQNEAPQDNATNRGTQDNIPANDTALDEEESTLSQIKKGVIEAIKKPFKDWYFVHHFERHQKLLSYFEAISSQLDNSADSREYSRISNIRRTTQLMQRKLHGLSGLSPSEQRAAKSMLERCEAILKKLEDIGLQTQLLSYGSKAPESFDNVQKAHDAIQAYFGNENSAEASNNNTSTSKKPIDHITAAPEKATIDISRPKDENLTVHYLDLATKDNEVIKGVTLNYNEQTTYTKDKKTGATGTTNQYRADILLDKNTIEKLRPENQKVNLGITRLTSTLPSMAVMKWARDVLNTFLADPRAVPPLKFNFPELPKTCMIALVLHAKMQGIPVSRYSNFRGQLKVEDVKSHHVKSYVEELKKIETENKAMSKEPGDYAAERIERWGLKK